MSARVVCLGEAMVELSDRQGRWDVHYGGDTLNVALHLTRLGFDVAYLTALGSDPFAGSMRSAWGREGLDVSLVLTDPDRTTGLYCIETDEKGERHFSYWRGESAARRLFNLSGIDMAVATAERADLLFFSLISLAILPDEGRELVISLARQVRTNGGRVAFDNNYRPRLWDGPQTARMWRDRAAAVADFGLPSLSDETLLDGTESAQTVHDHWLMWGCREVVVKLGADGILLPDGTVTKPEVQHHALDTSGAGDAFDAGYLAARLRGCVPEEAAAQGQQLAGWTVMRYGAIPERDHMAPYAAMMAQAAPASD